MRRHTVTCIALLAAIISPPIHAETISWQMPTKNVDGSAIPATGSEAIKETQIQVGTCNSSGGFGSFLEAFRPLAPIVSIQWLPAMGTYCLRARVFNNAGVNGDFSAVVAYTKTASKPGTITISITATVPP